MSASSQYSTTLPPLDETNKALVRRVYAAFSGGDPDDLDTAIADDFAHHPLVTGEQPGRDGFKGVIGVCPPSSPTSRLRRRAGTRSSRQAL